MQKRIDIRSIQIYGCTKILGITLIVIISSNCHMQRFADVAINNHWNGYVSRKCHPPGEVRRTDAKRSQLHDISNRSGSLVGILTLNTYFDIIATAGQPFGHVLLD